MPERLMGTDCKSVSIAYVGSNPTRPNEIENFNAFAKKIYINHKFKVIL